MQLVSFRFNKILQKSHLELNGNEIASILNSESLLNRYFCVFPEQLTINRTFSETDNLEYFLSEVIFR